MIQNQKNNKRLSDAQHSALERVITCRVCGQRKVHHRQYGYRCVDPTHEMQEQDIIREEYRIFLRSRANR